MKKLRHPLSRICSDFPRLARERNALTQHSRDSDGHGRIRQRDAFDYLHMFTGLAHTDCPPAFRTTEPQPTTINFGSPQPPTERTDFTQHSGDSHGHGSIR